MEDLMDEFKKSDIPGVVDKMLADVFKVNERPTDPLGGMCKSLQEQMLMGLNKKWGIEGSVRFCLGVGGMTKVVLQHGDGATDGNIAEVYLHGAHVTRWSVGGYDALWVSPDAVFESGKAIRGGIPICWPQFGPGALPQHGFLRNSSSWTVVDTSANANNVSLTLQHTSNDSTLAQWEHPFCVSYTIHLKPHTLTTSMKVENTGHTSFDFTTALHTYFNVPQIEKTRIEGLSGLQYMDNLQDRAEVTEETTESLSITQETDRIYIDTPEELVVHDGCHGKTILHKSPSLPEAVLWNPWVEKASKMKDFNNFGWRNMVCVEAGAIKAPVTLKKGETWYGSQTLSVDLKEQ